jgi:hypothetical protein
MRPLQELVVGLKRLGTLEEQMRKDGMPFTEENLWNVCGKEIVSVAGALGALTFSERMLFRFWCLIARVEKWLHNTRLCRWTLACDQQGDHDFAEGWDEEQENESL